MDCYRCGKETESSNRLCVKCRGEWSKLWKKTDLGFDFTPLFKKGVSYVGILEEIRKACLKKAEELKKEIQEEKRNG